MAIVHPREPLSYSAALAYVEDWLTENALSDEDRAIGFACKVHDYHDGDENSLIERPWTGVRIAEVDFTNGTSGATYMQVDQPWGIAYCGQVERCVLALVENWNRNPTTSDGEEYGETDEEFGRLALLIEEARKIPPTAVTVYVYVDGDMAAEVFTSRDEVVTRFEDYDLTGDEMPLDTVLGLADQHPGVSFGWQDTPDSTLARFDIEVPR